MISNFIDKTLASIDESLITLISLVKDLEVASTEIMKDQKEFISENKVIYDLQVGKVYENKNKFRMFICKKHIYENGVCEAVIIGADKVARAIVFKVSEPWWLSENQSKDDFKSNSFYSIYISDKRKINGK